MSRWFAVRSDLPGPKRWVLSLLSFLLPLGLWCLVSYNDSIWHPYHAVSLAGGTAYKAEDRVPNADFTRLRGEIQAANAARLSGAEAPASASAAQRANRAALGQVAELAIANEWIEPAQIRDHLTVLRAAEAYLEGELAAPVVQLEPENREVLQGIVEAFRPLPVEGRPTYPGDSLLPELIPQGYPANPVYLPAPHQVAMAFYTAFTTPPRRDGDPWLHERLGSTLQVLGTAFVLAMLVGIPLGILVGTFDFFGRLVEPFVNFVSYIPPPAFAALLVAVFGIAEGPKVGMVFIASFFPMVLMIGKTTRLLDRRLLEAGQVLGCDNRRLIGRIILPGIMPNIYNDLRILLALGWTILIIAEVTGTMSGLSYYMYQQGRYRVYENVFAVMVLIGLIGLIFDQILAWLAPFLFPWTGDSPTSGSRRVMAALTYLPRQVGRFSDYLHEGRHDPYADIRDEDRRAIRGQQVQRQEERPEPRLPLGGGTAT